MMKRKLAASLALVLATTSIALSATACGNSHEHTWGTFNRNGQIIQMDTGVYRSDENNHWKECDECGEAFEVTAHTLGTAEEVKATTYEDGYKQTPCTVCGYKKVEVHEGSMVGKTLATAPDVKADYAEMAEINTDLPGIYKLHANTTYYFHFKPAKHRSIECSSTYLIEEDGSKGGGVELDFEILYVEGGKEKLFGTYTDVKVGYFGNTGYSQGFHGKTFEYRLEGFDFYLKFTTPAQDMMIEFDCYTD